jgi:hypothetical protein
VLLLITKLTKKNGKPGDTGDKRTETYFSLMKQPELPVSALNATVKICHIIEETANRCEHSQTKIFHTEDDITIFFKK